MKFMVNKKTIQIFSMLSIVGMIVLALFTDFKRDFYNGFLYNIFTEESAEKTCLEMDGEMFEIKDNTILSLNSKESDRNKGYAEKLISKPNGTYYKGGNCFEKKEKNIYCVSTLKLLAAKLKIKRQNVSYLPYLILIIFISIILSRFLTKEKIGLEFFCLILLEQIFNFTLIIRSLGFYTFFDNCYTALPFYFYLAFLLLQFFAIKKEKLFYVYFVIIYISIVVTFFFDVMMISKRPFEFDLNKLQMIIFLIVISRHCYKIVKKGSHTEKLQNTFS